MSLSAQQNTDAYGNTVVVGEIPNVSRRFLAPCQKVPEHEGRRGCKVRSCAFARHREALQQRGRHAPRLLRKQVARGADICDQAMLRGSPAD